MNKLKFAACLLIASQATFAKLSKKCVDEMLDIPNTNPNFVLQDFLKDLPPTVVKIKGKCVLPMFCPKDSEKTDVGITAGCAKEFPQNPGEIKVALMDIGLGMARGVVANKLGVTREEIPNNIGQLKDVAANISRRKVGEALGVDASEIPTNLKGVEAFAVKELRNQAVSKLGVEKNDIPKEKSELAPFLEKAAKRKIANTLKINSSKIDFSPTGLQKIANERPDLAPAANIMNAVSVLNVLSMVSALDVLGGTGGGGGDDEAQVATSSGKIKSPSEGTAAPVINKIEEEEYATFHIDWDNI